MNAMRTHATRFCNLFLAAVAGLSLAFADDASAANDRHRVEARMFGPTILKGKARYEERPKDGTLRREFKVEVERGVPGQVLDIRVNGDIVGSLVVNSFGRGKFKLRTPQFIDSPGDGEPMPPNFPSLGIGDVASAGPITGVFLDKDGGGGGGGSGGGGGGSVQDYRLRGDFSGDGLASGHAEYREQFKNGGLERRFKVEVEDAAAGQSFDVFVNDLFVQTITTNGAGFIEFQLRTAQFIDSPGDGVPMPNNFPSLQAGDVVRVGSMTTVLQPKDGGGSGGSGSGGSGSGSGSGGEDDDDDDDDNSGPG